PFLRFRPAVVSKVIHQVLVEHLQNQTYDPEKASKVTADITETIKNKLKELELSRYKYIVNVTLGENRGEAARVGCRCMWDADTDNVAQDIFTNDSLFCVAVAFGVYYY
ncbi:Tctex-1, partial [Basidiobolus meristosporus CBS 931.73]